MGLGDIYDYGINSPLDYSSDSEAEADSFIGILSPVRRSLWHEETDIGFPKPTFLPEPVAEPQSGFPKSTILPEPVAEPESGFLHPTFFTEYDAHIKQVKEQFSEQNLKLQQLEKSVCELKKPRLETELVVVVGITLVVLVISVFILSKF